MGPSHEEVPGHIDVRFSSSERQVRQFSVFLDSPVANHYLDIALALPSGEC